MADEKKEFAHQIAVEGRLVKRVFAAQDLITQLNTLVLTKDDDKKILSNVFDDLDKAKKEYDAMNDALEKKSSELAQKQVQLDSTMIEAENQKAAYVKAHNDYLQMKEKYENLVKSNTVTYSTNDISIFLNETIKKFNDEHSSDNKLAQYVINSMDVDLKVRVFDDSQNDKENPIKFVAPSANETSEDSLSSIKISIQAVPITK